MDPVLPVVELAPKPKTNILVWIIGGIIVFGVGIGIGLFLAKNIYPPLQIIPTPTPAPIAIADPTANWKTYTNDKLGFSYQYPSDWQLTTALDLFAVSSKKDGTIIQIHRYSDLPKGYSSVATWFNDLRTKKQKSVLPNDGFYYGPGSDNPYKWYMYYKMDNFKEIEIDKISAIVTSSNTGLAYVIVPTEKYVYEITVNPTGAYENVTVGQILSTFKFVN